MHVIEGDGYSVKASGPNSGRAAEAMAAEMERLRDEERARAEHVDGDPFTGHEDDLTIPWHPVSPVDHAHAVHHWKSMYERSHFCVKLACFVLAATNILWAAALIVSR